MSTKQSINSKGTFIVLSLLSWTGMFIHNRFELPAMSLLRPEYLVPTSISMILSIGWLFQVEYQRLWTVLLIIWTGIHFLIGAWLSVLPLSIWPFDPEQSPRHYLAHVVYGVAQLPLLWGLVTEIFPSLTPEDGIANEIGQDGGKIIYKQSSLEPRENSFDVKPHSD